LKNTDGISSCTESIDVLESEQSLGQAGPRTLFSTEYDNGKSIKDYSWHQSENEVLLLPTTQFRVKRKLSPAPGLHIIHLKVKSTYCLLESPINYIIIAKGSIRRDNEGVSHTVGVSNATVTP
jgi:hypothetical protein